MLRRIGMLWGLLAAAMPDTARAADDLVVLEVRVDRPTLRTLGVQVLVSDDDNRDAVGTMRAREVGGQWRDAPTLFRVRPEIVGIAVPEQLAGSVFDLEPGTSYEIEVHLVDPDGLDQTEVVEATTRAIPQDPAAPNEIAVADAGALGAALAGAQPGDVIVLAAGTYGGTFSIQASGTETDPIVIRGEGAVLDGEGCVGCNVLEVYGSWVHVEDLTIQNGERGLRWQGSGAQGNVLRRTVISNVLHGVGSQAGQLDFYVCDNEIVGRLDWPWVFDGDASSHWDDRGVDLNGEGHVICHNHIEGFGDPMVNLTEGTRAWDFYGNDVYDCFDGIELDRTAGNVRVFRNRWVNVDSAISMQPVNGGPAYVLRNELINVVSEQLKLKQTGGEPSGALVHHNTFVSASLALNLQTPITVHNFVVSNNLFVGPQALASGRTVDWTAGVDGDRFDYNGYFPDGGFWFGGERVYESFAEAMGSGEVEGNGVLLEPAIFVSGAVGPADPMVASTADELDLDAASNAIDAGEALPGVNDGYRDAAPDLGARELGCAAPTYGPRPAANEADYVPVDCREDEGGDDSGSSGGSDGGSDDNGDASGATSNDGDGSNTGGGATSASSAGDTDTGSSADENADGCGCRSHGSPPWFLVVLLAIVGGSRAPRRRPASRRSALVDES